MQLVVTSLQGTQDHHGSCPLFPAAHSPRCSVLLQVKGGSLLFGAASLGLDPMQSQSGDANMGQAPDKGLLSTGGADIMK